MLRLAAIVALLAASLAKALAADIAVQSRFGTPLGPIYAEPAAPRSPVVTERVIGERFVYAPEVYIPPLVNGYYGKPNSFLYENYYGTSPITIFGRLPYACGWHGYC